MKDVLGKKFKRELVYEFDQIPSSIKAGGKFIMNDQLFRVIETEGNKIRAKKIMKTKTKKYKVEISKEKVVIKPLPDMEIDEVLLFKINKHFERDGIFKPIKKELPKTWDEYLESNPKGAPPWLMDWAAIPKKYKALGKCEILRDVYNDGWEPNCKDDSDKFSICVTYNNIEIGRMMHESRTLSFKNVEVARQFLTNFIDLIEQAKPLL